MHTAVSVCSRFSTSHCCHRVALSLVPLCTSAHVHRSLISLATWFISTSCLAAASASCLAAASLPVAASFLAAASCLAAARFAATSCLAIMLPVGVFAAARSSSVSCFASLARILLMFDRSSLLLCAASSSNGTSWRYLTFFAGSLLVPPQPD